MDKQIIIFGYGYVSKFLIKHFKDSNWDIYCTSRKVDLSNPVKNGKVTIINFLDPEIPAIIKSSNICLSTIPPSDKIIDPVLAQYFKEISSNTLFEWIGYLSSTSVYGDHSGSWVNEQTLCVPSNKKAKLRFIAEQQWLKFYNQNNLPINILRLSGIYGPNRNCLEQIMSGKDYTIAKNDHYFSRIHVNDICMAIKASIKYPTKGEIYNISDDEPAPLNIVQQFGASILDKEQLKEIPFEQCKLSEQAKCFFDDNKKISNQKIKATLKVTWAYPNYRIGLVTGCLPYLSKS